MIIEVTNNSRLRILNAKSIDIATVITLMMIRTLR